MANNVPRPFLKWAGGKTRLIDELTSRMPAQFAGYHEPFLGGGALFFGLYRAQRIRQAFISDINAELIDAYIAIRDRVDAVIELLLQYPHSEEFYYELRSLDPWKLDLPERAARMIYLNKTGYNGLYRVNRQGKFNVPFGRYKSPKYYDHDNLKAVSNALQEISINCIPFDTVLENAQAGDWVYFDPPYAPLSKTSNFTTYHVGGFSAEDQERLRDVCLALTEKGVYVTLSNSDTPPIRELYSGFIIGEVLANRAINSKGGKRGKIRELMITNYSPEQSLRPQFLGTAEIYTQK
ncbi:MAG: DNA adenine methylase [Anaerolineae bacterium]